MLIFTKMSLANQTRYSNLQSLLVEESWRELIGDEFQKPYWAKLIRFIDSEIVKKDTHYPEKSAIFNTFNLCPVKSIRIVIVGQDPYIFKNQAHGLCFSVMSGVKIPPSLINVFEELKNDLGPDNFAVPKNGDLTAWAKRGVFLLNTALTVRANEPGSHLEQGWSEFTTAVLNKLVRVHPHLVFVLWGVPAQRIATSIDLRKHFVVKSSHPSPKSADRGFFGSKFASVINKHFVSRGEAPFDWTLEEKQ